MGGRIWAESPAARRRGTRLLVALPVAKEPRHMSARASSSSTTSRRSCASCARRWKPRAMTCCTPRPGARRCASPPMRRPTSSSSTSACPTWTARRCSRRRAQFTQAPILILSARDREAEKIAALDLGADDYVEKPFAIGELLARLRAALRHARGRGGAEDPRRGRRPRHRHGQAPGDPRRRGRSS